MIVLFSIPLAINQKLRYNQEIFFLGLVNVFTSFFFVYLGIFLSAPGAIRISTVYILWPISYIYFIGFSTNISNLYKLTKVILYGSLISCFFSSTLYNKFVF